MRLKNSVKLAFANFSLFWKIALYKLIVIALTALLLLPVWRVLVETFSSLNLFDEVLNFCTSTVFFNIPEIFIGLKNVVDILLSGIIVLVNSHLFVFIYTMIIIFVVSAFLSNLSDVPASETLYGYMTSLAKYGYTNSFITNLGKSSIFSILKTLVEIPVKAIICIGSYYILSLLTYGGVFKIIVPILAFVYLVLTIAVYQSIISLCAPSIVAKNAKSVNTFKDGITHFPNTYLKTLSDYIVLMVLYFSILLLFGGFSLIVLLPLGIYVTTIVNMVFYFTKKGMRYYVDLETIITPQKVEENEQINKIKNIL